MPDINVGFRALDTTAFHKGMRGAESSVWKFNWRMKQVAKWIANRRPTTVDGDEWKDRP